MITVKLPQVTCLFHPWKPANRAMVHIENYRQVNITTLVPICRECQRRQAEFPDRFDLRIRTAVKRWNLHQQALQRQNIN